MSNYSDFTMTTPTGGISFILPLNITTTHDQESITTPNIGPNIVPNYTLNRKNPVYLLDIASASGITGNYNSINGFQSTDYLTFTSMNISYRISYNSDSSNPNYILQDINGNTLSNLSTVTDALTDSISSIMNMWFTSIIATINTTTLTSGTLINTPLSIDTSDNALMYVLRFLSVYDPINSKDPAIATIIANDWAESKQLFSGPNFDDLMLNFINNTNKSNIVKYFILFLLFNKDALDLNSYINYPFNMVFKSTFTLTNTNNITNPSITTTPIILVTN